MLQQTSYPAVRIGTKDKATLSKSQKEFNGLTRKIEELTADLHNLREATIYVQQRIQTDYRPLVEQYSQLQANMIRSFDRAYNASDYTKQEKKKLADLIRSIAIELITAHGLDDLKPLYDKYNTEEFDTASTRTDEETAQLMKEMIEPLFGEQVGHDGDVSDFQKIAEQEAAEQERQQQRAARPKTAKQQEREAKKEAEDYKTTKAVRQLYMDLVKAFHPDREPDEAEKVRKTEIMHRVTGAYEKSDLMALLQLQLEFERIDQAHLENLAQQQLRYYNKILRQQTEELNGEIASLQTQLAVTMGRPTLAVSNRTALEFSLNGDIADLKRNIKALKKDLNAFTNAATLRQWLRTYRIHPID